MGREKLFQIFLETQSYKMVLHLQFAAMYITVSEYIQQVLSCSELSVKYPIHVSRPKKQLQ